MMNVVKKIVWCVVLLALLYGAFLVVERLTRQELTRVSQAQTGETAAIMWQPRLLRGDGVCSIDLLNAQGKVVDSATISTQESGFEALQQFGLLTFEEQTVSVYNVRTSQLARRFVVKDGRLQKAD